MRLKLKILALVIIVIFYVMAYTTISILTKSSRMINFRQMFYNSVTLASIHPDTNNMGLNYMHSSQCVETSAPELSRYRKQFLLWYNSRPDIVNAIGSDRDVDSRKYIIYRCDTGILSYCGGWADRIKGIIAAYIVANITGRSFKVEWLARGCNISHYLIPNLVNWTLPVVFHESLNESQPDTTIATAFSINGLYKDVSQTNFSQTLGSKKFVYFKTNVDFSRCFQNSNVYKNQLSWMKNITGAEILATLYKRLFMLHPRLQVRLQMFLVQNLPTIHHKLVCVHVRMGKNPSIPKDTEVRNSLENLSQVWKFVEKHSITDLHKVFIMSDSEETLLQASLQSFSSRIIANDGPIVHVQKSRKLSNSYICEGEEKIVLDQHVLMNCDVLMISNSGLSRLAAYVRGSDVDLYCLLKDGHIVPCYLRSIIELYNIVEHS